MNRIRPPIEEAAAKADTRQHKLINHAIAIRLAAHATTSPVALA